MSFRKQRSSDDALSATLQETLKRLRAVERRAGQSGSTGGPPSLPLPIDTEP